MTTHPLLQALLPLVDDLSRELVEAERYRRLLSALRALIPCDATALLRLEGEQLVPLAVDGLSPDTLGRRFAVAEHPRFAALLAERRPTRFAADSQLPDPYDGLVEEHVGHLEVHDCLGCPLYIDERPWGLLTLDSLRPAASRRTTWTTWMPSPAWPPPRSRPTTACSAWPSAPKPSASWPHAFAKWPGRPALPN